MSESDPAISTVNLSGEIDLNRSSEVSDLLKPLIESKLPAINIDFSEVRYIDSSGLAVLIDALQNIQAYGGKLSLSGMQKNIRAVFQIARLDQVFTITE